MEKVTGSINSNEIKNQLQNSRKTRESLKQQLTDASADDKEKMERNLQSVEYDIIVMKMLLQGKHNFYTSIHN